MRNATLRRRWPGRLIGITPTTVAQAAAGKVSTKN
jgi:hypothetical protein